MADSVTVTVDEFGRVTVNGKLVAEVAVGMVDGRDDLARNLTLHRIAGHMLDAVRRGAAELRSMTDKERARAATGLVDGLLDVTVAHPSPGVPPILPSYDRQYEAGYVIGQRFRTFADHIDRTSDESRVA